MAKLLPAAILLSVTFTFLSSVNGSALGGSEIRTDDADRGERSAFRFPTPTGILATTEAVTEPAESTPSQDEDVQQEEQSKKSNNGNSTYFLCFGQTFSKSIFMTLGWYKDMRSCVQPRQFILVTA